MKLSNPFKKLSAFEWLLYIVSLLFVSATPIISGGFDAASFASSAVGATALIFVSKGEPLGQLLTVVFALLYAYISYSQRYYGEMITYLGMTTPIAVTSLVSWLRNPFEEGKSEVRVEKLTKRQIFHTVAGAIAATIIFHFVLKALNTPRLLLSTVSITTSFTASYLTVLRSPYYALAYAANDIVLIALWTLASIRDPSYCSTVACFIVFFINDTYGFINWQRIKKRQTS